MMLRKAIVIFALLFMVVPCQAQVTVLENPTPTTSFVEASVKLLDGEAVSWDVSPEPSKQIENGGTLYFNGPAGTYKVTALVQSIVNGKIVNKKSKLSVVIGVPTPPKPVVPDVPPTPTDPFVTAIQVAYTAETAADKVTSMQKLASLYRVAAKTIAPDPTVTNYGQLFDTIKAASATMLPATAIPGVRKVVGTRLNPQFGAASTAINRTLVASEFNAIADALSSAK